MNEELVIIDSDPGVDDATCLFLALTDPRLDIKLLTSVSGNVPVEQSSRSILHILDLLDIDKDVVKGDQTEMENAMFMHGKNAIGGYQIPSKTKRKLKTIDVADAMFETIKRYPNQITILMCGPHTNVAKLLKKYPSSKKLIKQIIFMGGSLGLPNNPNHVSYNSRADAKSFDCVVKSKIKTIMIPSSIGRTKARFTKSQVDHIEKMNDFGSFLAKTFSTYWEPGFTEQFVSNNDVCTYMYLVEPQYFKIEPVDIHVDYKSNIGKLTAIPNKKSNLFLVTDLNRTAFIKFMYSRIKSLSYLKI